MTSNITELKADYKAAAAFLGGLPTEAINVCAIWPEGDRPMKSHSYSRDDKGVAAAEKFMKKYGDLGYNLYFYCNDLSVRLSKSKRLDGEPVFKADESEVAAVNMLFIDLDPAKGTAQADLTAARAVLLAQAKAYQPPPTIIINSGNGYGLFWNLDKPIKVTPENLLTLKGYNKTLIDALGGDPHCVDLCHVMRIPYTVNVPNMTKRKAGRVHVLASLICDDSVLNSYSINIFTSAHLDADAASSGVTSGSEYEQIGSPDIPESVDLSKLPPKLHAEIVNGAPAGADRSATVYGVACALRRAGFSDGAILYVLTNPDYKISEHILDQPQREHEDQAARIILDMNAKHVEKIIEPDPVDDFADSLSDDVKKKNAIRKIVSAMKVTIDNATAGEVENAEALVVNMAKRYNITEAEIAAAIAVDAVDCGQAKSGKAERADTAPLHEAVEPNETWTSLLKNFVYVTQQARFVRKSDGKIWKVEDFERAYKFIRFWANPGGKVPLSVTQHIFDGGPNLMEHFDSFAFAPGQLPRYNDDYNQWLPSKFKPAEGDTTLWDAHLAYLIPDEAKRNRVLDWMAWVYQHPTDHPEYAIAMIGAHTGTGKTFLPTVLSLLLSGTAVSRLRQSTIQSAHQTWPLRTKLPIIEVFEADKELTAILQDMIRSPTTHVDMKNAQDFDILNVLAFWIESNAADAIMAMNNTDRCFDIVSVDNGSAHLLPLADSYYWKLYGRKGGPKDGLIDNPALMGAIAYQLMTRDLSKYSGNRAPFSADKTAMQAETGSAVKRWMVDEAYGKLGFHLFKFEDVLDIIPKDIERDTRNLRKEIIKVLTGAPFYAENLGKVTSDLRLWYSHRAPGAKPIKGKYKGKMLAARYHWEHKGSFEEAKATNAAERALTPKVKAERLAALRAEFADIDDIMAELE